MGVNYLNSNNFTNQLEILHLNSEQAKDLVIDHARQLVNQLIELRGHDKPPFLPEEFISLQGIKEIVKAKLGETSAILLRFHDGYVIKVNESHHPVRQNFSCAHEIGHILFSELKLERYIHTIEYRTFNPQARAIARARARERLCDAAATELLMPESVFRKYLSGFGLSISSIEHLARVFRVSVQAAAIRIAEVSIDPCLALLWKPWPKNNPKGLRLAWCIGKGKNILPLQQLVKNSSKLYEAYKRDNPVKSSKVFRVDKNTKRLSMESKGFGYGETRYVISLAFLDK